MGALDEGVIKFSAHHRHAPLPQAFPQVPALLRWRALLWDQGLVGQQEGRYGGAGFGNLSFRVPPGGSAFVVTGTQTGGPRALPAEQLALVTAHNAEANSVDSVGLVMPSSEAMTHGTLYAADPDIHWVFHVHSPALWNAARTLGIPRTAAEVPYGTPQMAAAVEALVKEGALRRMPVFSMDGHEDGVVAVGRTADDAGSALLAQVARASVKP